MIVLNGRFLTQTVTGVQRFAREVGSELLRLRDDMMIAVPPGPVDLGGGFENASVETVGRRGGHLWEQIELPRFLASVGRPLLLSLTSTGPMSYRPQVSTHHDITYVRHPESFALAFRALYRVIVPRLLRSSARVITVSEFSAREIASHYRIPRERLVVVPNAADALFRSRRAEAVAVRGTVGRPYLLAVSSPNAHKNIDRLIQAFLQLDEGDDISLKIVGSQSSSFTRRRVDDSRGSIEVLGRVDDAELACLYAGARAFVFPSLYEGFGIPPLEAQAAGAPVLAARAASMPEVLGDSARYFDPLSVDSIAQAMSEVLGDAELRDELRRRSLENAARYTWAHSAALVDAAVDEILGTGAAGDASRERITGPPARRLGQAWSRMSRNGGAKG